MIAMTWTRRRKALAVVAAAFIVVFAWFSYEVLAVYYSEPNPTVDSRAVLRSLALDGAGITAEQGDAAWALLERIFDAVEEVEAEVNAMCEAGEFEERDEYFLEVEYGRVENGPTLPVHLEPERRVITMLQDRGVFDELRRFSGGPPGLRPMPGAGPLTIDTLLVDLSRARNLAQMAGAAMRLSAAGGDFAGAAEAFDHTLALSRTMAGQPYLLSYLTAAAIESLAIGELQFELMELQFDEASCRALIESIDRQGTFPGVEFPIEAERVFGRDWQQWSYSDDGNGDGYLVSAPYGEPDQSLFGAAVRRFFYETRAEARTAHDDYFDRMVAVSRMDSTDQARAFAESAEGIESFIRHRRIKKTRIAATRVMVTLQLHRSLHGGYPASLDELAGEPPVDPLHGLPFGYRLLVDDPDGCGYLLYSIGLDRTDDGGADLDLVPQTVGGYGALTDPDLTGADFVFNKPRHTWAD